MLRLSRGLLCSVGRLASTAVPDAANSVYPLPVSARLVCRRDVHCQPEELGGVAGVMIARNCFDKTECEMIVAAGETAGFIEAPVTTRAGPVMMPGVRTNKRVMFLAEDSFMEEFARRIQPLVPESLSDGRWRLLAGARALNPRLRFYRYGVTDEFKPHFDGAYRESVNVQSHFTVLVYLNEGYVGGETVFYPRTPPGGAKDLTGAVKASTDTGTVVIFPHIGPQSPLHAGSPHTSEGRYKYVLRSDVMYERVEKQ